MKLESTRISGQSNGKQRLAADVRYGDGSIQEYWFDLPVGFQPTRTGNPWIALLLPHAATSGQDLEISVPVDPVLLDGAQSLARLWRAWYPHLRPISITAPVELNDFQGQETAGLFSGGVDSFFTVLRHPEIRYLITIQGMDLPIGDTSMFDRFCAARSKSARCMGKTLSPVVTNMRTRLNTPDWEAIGFGAGAISVALTLERHFKEIMIASSLDYSALAPNGSHPLSDPLLSTSTTRIAHEGAAYTRFEKLEFISQYDVARQGLHVCFSSHGEGTCSRCSKCYRTMIALELLGVLDRFPMFDRSKFQVDQIGRLLVHGPEFAFFEEMRAQASERGRADIAKEIEKCVRRSLRIQRLAYLRKVPVFWRLYGPLHDRSVRRSIYY